MPSTSRTLLITLAGFCFLGLALGAKAESGVEILSKKHEIMDQINKRNLSTAIQSLEHFALSAALTLDTFVESHAKSIANANCLSGIIEVFAGSFGSLAICIAAIAVYLITGAIAAGLKSLGVTALSKKDAEPYLEIEHFGNKVRYDKVGVAYDDLVKRDNALVIDLPSSFDVKNVRIYTNYVGDAAFNTISYTDDLGTHYGIENNNNIANYFNNLEDSGLTKRDDSSSAHFTVGTTFDISSDEESLAKSVQKSGPSIKALADYFSSVKSQYCLAVQHNGSPLINGELFINTRGNLSSECTTQSNFD